MKCASCGGCAHPASGCQYSETVIICGPCTRAFWEWMRSMTNDRYDRIGPRGSGKYVNFYDYVKSPLTQTTQESEQHENVA